jgi:protein TonB
VTDGTLHLNAPPAVSFKKGNLLLALGFLGTAALFANLGSHILRVAQSPEDEVQIVQVAPPVPVAEPLPVRPRPVPPDPDHTPQPVKPNEAPPPPVFGIPDDATSKQGDMAVATGNTLMKPADPVVQQAPPPLPGAPVELDREPAIVHQVIPEYPAWAEEQGVTATVKLQVTIDPQGNVQNIALVSADGNDFAHNAIKAVKATRFQPLVKDGVAQAARFMFTFRFVL